MTPITLSVLTILLLGAVSVTNSHPVAVPVQESVQNDLKSFPQMVYPQAGNTQKSMPKLMSSQFLKWCIHRPHNCQCKKSNLQFLRWCTHREQPCRMTKWCTLLMSAHRFTIGAERVATITGLPAWESMSTAFPYRTTTKRKNYIIIHN